jgi:uncharacterized protein (TIGR00369 family)
MGMDGEEFSAEAAGFVQEYIEDRHDFLSWLNTRVERIDRGCVVMTVPYDAKLTNKPPHWRETTGDEAPSMHGGVAATLLDTAGGIAQRTMLPDPLAGGVATVNLNVNYLRRATGDLTATAEVVRSGSSIGVSTVTVESPAPHDGAGGGDPNGSDTAGETRAVATGQASYRLFP